jgi:PilZ domain-containing protein
MAKRRDLNRVREGLFWIIRDIIAGTDFPGGNCMSQERRRSPRYPFFAAAELVEDASQVRLTTHLSELSMNGCYLDIMNPFPAGSSVRITISDGPASIQCQAKVVYSQPNMGMGLAFANVDEKCVKVLEAWMEKAKNT